MDTVKRDYRKDLSDLSASAMSMRISENKIFADLALKIFGVEIATAGEFALRQAGIAGSFDLLNPAVLIFLKDTAFRFADNLNETTLAILRKELLEAILNGEGIDAIQLRVQSVFADTVRGAAPRARTIARTSATSIFNGGQTLAFEQEKAEIETIEWLSSHDNRVRTSHTKADGQQREIGRQFRVGGALLKFPGDPNAPAREIINCRCTIVANLN